jgi:Domain of unknown function (4846)
MKSFLITVSMGIIVTISCMGNSSKTKAPKENPQITKNSVKDSKKTNKPPKKPLDNIKKSEKTLLPTKKPIDIPKIAKVSSNKLFSFPTIKEQLKMYPWKRRTTGYSPISKRIPTPKGYKRVILKKRSYQYYLRHLPLLPPGTKVKDYKGNVLHGSDVAAAVIDMDVGKRDLQQCMDTIQRVRGEYYWSVDKSSKVTFRFGSSIGYFGWAKWRRGFRPVRKGRRWKLVKKRSTSNSYKNFRRYLVYISAMTGTVNSTREKKVKTLKDLKAGDYFVHPAPSAVIYGHAVIIVDIAKNSKGKVKALIAQGYTPAQDFHVITSPGKKIWYDIDPKTIINTPLWPGFKWSDLRRFKH